MTSAKYPGGRRHADCSRVESKYPRAQTIPPRPDMRDLLIPYALDSSNGPVLPDRAFAGGDYRCPECKGRVGIRTPSEKRAHFFHLPPHGTCNLEPSEQISEGEGRLHAFAKHCLYAWLEQFFSDGHTLPPRFEGICSRHNRRFEVKLPQNGPFHVARENVTPEGRRVDVAVLDAAGNIALGIEIRATHQVSAEKAESLSGRWVELGAASIEKAYRKFLTGEIPPAINMLRWGKSDEPQCCKQPSGRQPFAALAIRGATQQSAATIPEPVKIAPEDSAIFAAAGAACRNGQSPQSFANSYAQETGRNPRDVLRRLINFGVARSGWTWS